MTNENDMTMILAEAAKAPITLVVKSASQTFQGKLVVKDIDFSVLGTETVAILGPSGCGKSTILRMVSGMYPRGAQMPSVGEVTIDGEKVIGPRDDVVTVFQTPALAPWNTVLGNVRLPFKAGLWGHGVPLEEQHQRANDILESVGLKDSATKFPHQLSGGMRQRAALAQSLVVRPRVICMDEPFSALDPSTRKEMRELVKALKAKYPCLILFVTHDVDEALDLADRVIVLSTRPATILSDIRLPPHSERPADWASSAEHVSLEASILQTIREAQGSSGAGSIRVSV